MFMLQELTVSTQETLIDYVSIVFVCRQRKFLLSSNIDCEN